MSCSLSVCARMCVRVHTQGRGPWAVGAMAHVYMQWSMCSVTVWESRCGGGRGSSLLHLKYHFSAGRGLQDSVYTAGRGKPGRREVCLWGTSAAHGGGGEAP